MRHNAPRLAASLLILAGLFALRPDSVTAQQATDRFAAVVAVAPAYAASAPGVPTAHPAPSLSADGIETTGFAQFMASPTGRVVRGVAGAAMIGGGIAVGGTGGTALAVVGAVPLSAGVLDLCYISALLGGPIRGEDIRAAGR